MNILHTADLLKYDFINQNTSDIVNYIYDKIMIKMKKIND